jgi:hypothetical protein
MFIGKNYAFNFLLVEFLKIGGFRSHGGRSGDMVENRGVLSPGGGYGMYGVFAFLTHFLLP